MRFPSSYNSTPFPLFQNTVCHLLSLFYTNRCKHANQRKLRDATEVNKNLASYADIILVPRAYNPFGLWLGSRALAGPNFLSMRRVFVSNSQPIRFARFDGKSVNRGLTVLDQTRALNPNHRPEGS